MGGPWLRAPGTADSDVLSDRLPDPRGGSAAEQPFDADDFVGIFDDWVREQGIRLYPAQEEAVLELVLAQAPGALDADRHRQVARRARRTRDRARPGQAQLVHRADQGPGEREVLPAGRGVRRPRTWGWSPATPA